MGQSTCKQVAKWDASSKDQHIDTHDSTTQVVRSDCLECRIGGCCKSGFCGTYACHQDKRQCVQRRKGKNALKEKKKKNPLQQRMYNLLLISPCQAQGRD